ncbi:MAG: ParB/RepB/Spo0J family partition protein [Bacteroidales bacterium]|jgi:ParB family chromosome partitioning protein|nr:ParB/RepB/Spo0J family partition protein [Bacteroidales bacterium]
MPEKQTKKRGLGQGLDALLGEGYKQPSKDIITSDSPSRIKEADLTAIDIDTIEANPWQPRTEFEVQALQELSDSIKNVGLIQPITVRKIENGHYQLIAGERRLRASKMAGLTQITAYIRTADDLQMLEMGLIENIQRSDLNPIEIALSFQRLISECDIRQEDLAEKVSKSRTLITNYLRLLKLCPTVQKAICENQLTMGHAKMLATIDDEAQQVEIMQKILSEDMSVRQVEALMRQLSNKEEKTVPTKVNLPIHFQNVKKQLRNIFDTEIEISRTAKGKGKIQITFKSDADFERITDKLSQS